MDGLSLGGISDCFLHSSEVVLEDRFGTARMGDLLEFAIWQVMELSAVDLPRVLDASDAVGIRGVLVEISRDIITVRGAVSETPDILQAPAGIVDIFNRGLILGTQRVDCLGNATSAVAF